MAQPKLPAKQARLLRSSKDLPAWYARENYDDWNVLSVAGWCGNLFIRRQILRIGPANPSVKPALNSLRGRPIADISGEEFRRFFDTEKFRQLLTYDSPRSAPVHSLTYREYGNLRSKNTEAYRLWEENYLSFLNAEDGANEDAATDLYRDWFDDPIARKGDYFDRNFATARVNMGLPDSILKTAFANWLVKERAQYPRAKGWPSENQQSTTFNRAFDPEEFVRYGLLPYLDLEIWAAEVGRKIALKLYPEKIFDLKKYGDLDDETVRRTTKPLADRFLTLENIDGSSALDLLIAQAANEYANEKPA